MKKNKLFVILAIIAFACISCDKQQEKVNIKENTINNQKMSIVTSRSFEIPTCDECCFNYADVWREICPQCNCMTDVVPCPERYIGEVYQDSSLLSRLYAAKRLFLASNTPLGNDIVTIYYDNAPNVTYTISTNLQLTKDSYALLKNIEPYIVDWGTSKGGKMLVSASIVNQIKVYLNQLIIASSNNIKLQHDINTMLGRIKIDEVVGLNSKEAWLLLIENYNKNK